MNTYISINFEKLVMRLLANDLTNQMYEYAKNEIQKVREIEES